MLHEDTLYYWTDNVSKELKEVCKVNYLNFRIKNDSLFMVLQDSKYGNQKYQEIV